MDKIIKLAEAIAREAGELLRSKFRTQLKISEKSQSNLVTEADLAAEELIVSRIRELYPTHSILAEEGGAREGGDDCLWIIDPLDGTNNFANGYPRFCVSIGLSVDSVIEGGVIYDPILDEMYIGQRGKGASVNGEAIQVSTETKLANSLCATGFPYDKATSAVNNLDNFSVLIKKVQGMRRDGAAALDLCYVARGVFEGFWELKLQPWDVAAGSLIVEEAGGKVSHLNGEPLDIYGDEILATNGHIHDAMVKSFPR